MEKNGVSSFLSSVLKGVLITLAISLFAVLVFSFIVKLSDLSVTAVKAVNQFIKVIAVFFGCFFTVGSERGLIRGAVTGFIATLSVYLVFMLISGESLFASVFLEALFGLILGAVSGIITVNVRKK